MKRTKKQKFLKRGFFVLITLFIGTVSAFSQIKVSGTILDDKNDPLIGANVIVKGTKNGTISDVNGKYVLEVPSRQSVLVFSYIGYKSVEKTIPSNGQLNVMLEEEAKTIDEVVVVAYGTQRKSHLTGAVSSLKNEKMDEIPVSRVDQALQGKIAGVQINNINPEAGAAPKIRVRGLGSISASSDPLVIVDGFPVPDGLSMVSMADVQSIEVLKDASSAALYGSRAAGGVILITTKKGESDKTKYNFKMYAGVRNPLKLPDMLSTQEYVDLLYKEASERMMDPAVNGVSTETMAFNKITDPERAGYLIMKYLDDQPIDWLQEGLRSHGTMQNYQLSASGGNKNLLYFVSGNYVNEEGVMKGSSYDKFTFRAKLDAKLSKIASIGVNITPTYSKREQPAVDLTDYMRFPSWVPIRHNEATAALTGKVAGDYAQPSDFNGINISGIGYYNDEVWNLQGVNAFSSSNQNPVSIRERTSIFTDDYRFQGNMYFTLNIIPGLQFKTSNGAYLQFREYNRKEQTSASKAGNPNSLTRQLTTHRELLSENTLNYVKRINKSHNIDALVGFTMQQSNNNYNQIVGTNFPDDNILSYNLASQILLDSPSIAGTTSFYYSESLVSLLGRVNYDYQGRYMLSASFRADGSSKFYEGHKWGTFPAVSAGWRASEEKFLRNVKWLSNLKVRGSYGLTGNNNIPQYAYMNSINTSNYPLGSGNGSLMQGMVSNSTALGNPDITWEQTAEANFGLDLGFVNSRFNLTVEYYNSNTIQLLLQQPAMYITGHQSYWNNIGKVNNKGLELELTTTNISNKNFTWKTTANLSTNKNKLLNYGNKSYEDNFGERSEVYRAIVGQPAIQYYGYKTDGVYTTFDEVNAAKALKDANGNLFTYTKFAPIVGGVKVVNINGDNKIDTEDRTVLGSPFPDFTWGITNTFNYRGFDLSFLFQGVKGGDIINGNVNYNEQLRYNKAYTDNRYVSPMFPGDGKTVYSNTTAGSDLMLTDYCIEDGSYGALRDFTLGYTFPKKVLKSIKLNSVRVYFSAENLLYIMAPGYRGINPEARRSAGSYDSPLVDGYQRGAFPLNRTFTGGLDINF